MSLLHLGEPFVQVLGTGVVAMGIMNWIGGEGDGSPGNGDVATEADGGDDLFGGMDDGGSGGDDPFGGDPFGDMADDGFGDVDGGDGPVTEELEKRLDDLESEVAQLSSSMNTVRSENEEIAEGVGETEENVRKLLEIYEMVTRGVNPFVDDASSGMGSAFGDGGDFGLFGHEDGGEEAEDDLDADITDAAAESFFDDDAFDDEDVGTEGDDFGDFEEDFDDFDDFDDDFEEPGAEGDLDDRDDAEGTDEGDGGSGGKTFEDLKAEYESGDADWADGESLDGTDEGDEGDVFALADEDGDAIGTEAEVGTDTGIDFELADAEPDGFEYGEAVDPVTEEVRRDPYLTALPEGYVVDLVVLEWIDSLVEEFGADNAVRAIDYYVEINWLSESVGESLKVYLDGLAAVEPGDDLTGPAEMDVDDHVRSLTLITRLADGGVDGSTIERRLRLGGPQHGLQC